MTPTVANQFSVVLGIRRLPNVRRLENIVGWTFAGVILALAYLFSIDITNFINFLVESVSSTVTLCLIGVVIATILFVATEKHVRMLIRVLVLRRIVSYFVAIDIPEEYRVQAEMYQATQASEAIIAPDTAEEDEETVECAYCRSHNDGDHTNCSNCGAAL